MQYPSRQFMSTKAFCDNLSLIWFAANHTADISKKPVVISFHSVCKAIAAHTFESY